MLMLLLPTTKKTAATIRNETNKKMVSEYPESNGKCMLLHLVSFSCFHFIKTWSSLSLSLSLQWIPCVRPSVFLFERAVGIEFHCISYRIQNFTFSQSIVWYTNLVWNEVFFMFIQLFADNQSCQPYVIRDRHLNNFFEIYFFMFWYLSPIRWTLHIGLKVLEIPRYVRKWYNYLPTSFRDT